MPKPKIPCPLPWSGLSALPMGISACCAFPTDLRSSAGESALEVFHGPRYRKIRKQLLEGQWPEECRFCQEKEELGLKSARHGFRESPVFKDLLERDDLTEEPAQLLSLEVSADRLCNLKCRMCSPQFSSKWDEDLPALAKMGDVVPPDHFRTREIPAIDVDSLLPHLGSLRELVFKGGEPLLSAQLEPFLEKIIALGLAPQIEIRMITNGTVFKPRVVSLFRQFKDCFITVSVDGPDPWFRYIRHGRFTLKDVQANLGRYAMEGLRVRSVLTAYQVYNMLCYARMVRKLAPFTKAFSITAVTSRGLDVRHAPEELRQKAAAQVEELLGEGFPEGTRETFREIIKILRSGRYEPDRWAEFAALTRGLDEVRGESLKQVDPELAAWL
jgi:MoaA/NifB/PqqE/SkfB family radical SAM enzyme